MADETILVITDTLLNKSCLYFNNLYIIRDLLYELINVASFLGVMKKLRNYGKSIIAYDHSNFEQMLNVAKTPNGMRDFRYALAVTNQHDMLRIIDGLLSNSSRITMDNTIKLCMRQLGMDAFVDGIVDRAELIRRASDAGLVDANEFRNECGFVAELKLYTQFERLSNCKIFTLLHVLRQSSMNQYADKLSELYQHFVVYNEIVV